jgi:hypothetical protein
MIKARMDQTCWRTVPVQLLEAAAAQSYEMPVWHHRALWHHIAPGGASTNFPAEPILYVWMRRPSRYGTPQRTHLRGLRLAISKKRPYLTGQVLRRKSERGDRHALAQGVGVVLTLTVLVAVSTALLVLHFHARTDAMKPPADLAFSGPLLREPVSDAQYLAGRPAQ